MNGSEIVRFAKDIFDSVPAWLQIGLSSLVRIVSKKQLDGSGRER